MKLLLLLAALPLWAQTTPVTITGTIRNPSGQLVTGKCTYSSARFTASGGEQIFPSPATVSFTAGVFSVKLIPTPDSYYYKVTCQNTSGTHWQMSGIWVVLSTSTTLASIWVTQPILTPNTWGGAAGAWGGL